MKRGETMDHVHCSLPAAPSGKEGQLAPSSGADQGNSKVDPSYKSKRYRDKLRAEIKALESLLPVDRSALHRRLDSQTVFRLIIAYFRTKMFVQATSLKPDAGSAGDVASGRKQADGWNEREVTQLIGPRDLLQAVDGFLLVITADGTILYVSPNIINSLGFNQVDLMHRCIYGIVHPDDHHELKMVLETSLLDPSVSLTNQRACCSKKSPLGATCKTVSFLVRLKCFNGTTTGYLKMQCCGHMRHLAGVMRSSRTSSHVVFALCRPFQMTTSTDSSEHARTVGFWSKHGLDMRFRHLDTKAVDILGYDPEELEGRSFYSSVYPEDLAVFAQCHRTLLHTEEIQTMYFRIQTKEGSWVWLHTRGKVVFKNSKKYSIVFTHCPVREEDSTYIQQEAAIRQRSALYHLGLQCGQPAHNSQPTPDGLPSQSSLPPHSNLSNHHSLPGHLRVMSSQNDLPSNYALSAHHYQQAEGQCPSTWHSQSECHSPVFPTTNLPHHSSPGAAKPLRASRRPRLTPDSPPTHTQENYFRPSDGQYNYSPQGVASSSSDCSSGARQQATPPHRHYLMQVNGFGLSPSAALPATRTLYFQGQLTTFETPAVGWSLDGDGTAYMDSVDLPTASLPTTSLPTASLPTAASLPNYGYPTTGLAVSTLPASGRPSANTSTCNLSTTETLRSDFPTSDFFVSNQCADGLPITDMSPTGPNNGLPSVDLSSSPLPSTRLPVTTGDRVDTSGIPRQSLKWTSRTTSGDRLLAKSCRHATCGRHTWPYPHHSDTHAVNHSVRPRPPQGLLPACQYHGRSGSGPPTPPQAACFRPASPAQVLNGVGCSVKMESTGSGRRGDGGADLPAIGSFLECLKDISG